MDTTLKLKLERFREENEESKKIKLLLDLLGSLRDETEREYELVLTKIAQIPGIDKLFNAVLESKLEEDREVAYAAFYGLNIYYRHLRDITKVGQLIKKYERWFQNHPTYPHIKSLYYRSTGSENDCREALKYARVAAEAVPDHAGILHSLAEIIINIAERKVRDCEVDLEEAKSALERAIELDPSYPKFYSTKGRLLALQGNFREAEKLIQKAIDMEDSGAHDYAIRLNGYYYLLSKINSLEISREILQALSSIDKARREAEEQLKQFRSESLQFLGLFAAIVSFTVAGIQFVSKQPLKEGVLLLLVFSGSLLCIYAGLSIMLHGRSFLYRILAILLLAAILILGPLFTLKGVSTS